MKENHLEIIESRGEEVAETPTRGGGGVWRDLTDPFSCLSCLTGPGLSTVTVGSRVLNPHIKSPDGFLTH